MASAVLDQFGRPYAPAYFNADHTRRFVNLRGGGQSANAALINNLDELRNRSHVTMRNNPYGWQGAEALVANWIGTGIRPESRAVLVEARELIDDKWEESVGELDAHGVTTIYGVQWQAAMCLVESGECLMRFRPRRMTDGLAVPLQVELIEPDHLPADKNERLANGNLIHAGIEFDLLGRRVAYHLHRRHPGDTFNFRDDFRDTVRVPASEVAHFFIARRPGQIRSEPWLSRVILALNDIDEFDDAELLRKKTAALFAGFVTSQDTVGVDPLSGQVAQEPEEEVDVEWEGGGIQFLPPGMDIKFAEPADVGNNFDPFLRAQHRRVAAGYGVTYEQLTGDLTGVNFSSIRAGLIEFRRRALAYIHHWICPQICSTVWTKWMQAAMVSGALPFAPQFAQDPRSFLKVRWVPQGFEFVNPNQEATAILAQLRMGTTTPPEQILRAGRTPRELIRELAEWNQMLDENGLRFTSDPRQEIPR